MCFCFKALAGRRERTKEIPGSVLIANRNRTNDSWQTHRVLGAEAQQAAEGSELGSGFLCDHSPLETRVGFRGLWRVGLQGSLALSVLVCDMRVSDADP